MMYGLIDKGVVAVVVEWDGVKPHIDAERLVKLPGNKLASEWIGVKKEDIAAHEPEKAPAPNPYPAPGPANRPPPHERVQDPSPVKKPAPLNLPPAPDERGLARPVSPPPAPKPAPVPPEQRAGPDPQTIKSVEKK